MLKIIITGAAGRMGKMNIRTVYDDIETLVAGAVEVKGSHVIGMDIGELVGVGKLSLPVNEDINEVSVKADVVIDFSSPIAVENNVNYAVSNNIAIVIGTTGLEQKHFDIIKNASSKIPVIWAPNFSVGINLLAKLTRMAAGILSDDFDAEIIEYHHRMKKDSPSGTAKKLLNVLKDAYSTVDVVYGREGMVGQRPKKQIGVHAIRGGDIVGEHTVLFAGIGERLELTHKASTRETFARGAIRAAKYIVKSGAGLYTMDDVLNL